MADNNYSVVTEVGTFGDECNVDKTLFVFTTVYYDSLKVCNPEKNFQNGKTYIEISKPGFKNKWYEFPDSDDENELSRRIQNIVMKHENYIFGSGLQQIVYHIEYEKNIVKASDEKIIVIKLPIIKEVRFSIFEKDKYNFINNKFDTTNSHYCTPIYFTSLSSVLNQAISLCDLHIKELKKQKFKSTSLELLRERYKASLKTIYDNELEDLLKPIRKK